MTYTTAFFDLDDTLYPATSGIWDAIGDRINQFMHERVGIPQSDVAALRNQLYSTYGTTLRGLKITRGIDELDYLAYVHDVPLEEYILPDPRARESIERIPLRKVIFTNADEAHALRVLKYLGLDGCFEQIIDILSIAPFCKPMPEAFSRALEIDGNSVAKSSIFIDDAPHNLRAAREAGFYTIRMGNEPLDGCCHAAVASVHELPGLVAGLLETQEGR